MNYRHRSHPRLLVDEVDLPNIVAEQMACLLEALADKIKRGDVTPPSRITFTVLRERAEGVGDVCTLLDSDADFVRFYSQ